ncbi:helix-turn-helix domain-containing protein [Lactococcus sp.]|uniref:helix-turn-helix domain-containing protein n=1 Tax=Lactococcus sp. TaxID=44273 RepID=UPI0035AEBB8F
MDKMLEKYAVLSDEELIQITGGGWSESIRTHRILNGMSQEELAMRVFVDVHTIRNWENHRTEIKGCDLYQLCEIFEITLDEMWDAQDKYKNR